MIAGLPNSLYVSGTRVVSFFGPRSAKIREEGMSVLTQLKRLLYDESGQGMVEYGLILALIALVVIGALSLFGDKIAEVFNKLRSEVEAELDPTP